jgi:pimeloyl-ACP methyl ester carboxylesterase
MRRGYAESGSGQVHYATVGDGPPLVLLGPAPRSWRAFEQFAPLLRDRFRLVMPDVPGFGASDPPPPGASMRDLAAGIVAVLDALDIPKAHVFGHNTGRLVAAAMAADWPARVDRLVVCGPTFALVPEQDVRIAAIRDFVASRYFDQGDGSGQSVAIREWGATFRNIVGEWWWTDALLSAADPATVVSALENRFIDELVARRTVRDLYRINFDFDFAAALRRAPQRSLVVEVVGRSADSGAFARQGERLAAMMPGARAVVMPQIEGAIGLFLLVGLEPLARVLRDFLEA